MADNEVLDTLHRLRGLRQEDRLRQVEAPESGDGREFHLRSQRALGLGDTASSEEIDMLMESFEAYRRNDSHYDGEDRPGVATPTQRSIDDIHNHNNENTEAQSQTASEGQEQAPKGPDRPVSWAKYMWNVVTGPFSRMAETFYEHPVASVALLAGTLVGTSALVASGLVAAGTIAAGFGYVGLGFAAWGLGKAAYTAVKYNAGDATAAEMEESGKDLGEGAMGFLGSVRAVKALIGSGLQKIGSIFGHIREESEIVTATQKASKRLTSVLQDLDEAARTGEVKETERLIKSATKLKDEILADVKQLKHNKELRDTRQSVERDVKGIDEQLVVARRKRLELAISDIRRRNSDLAVVAKEVEDGGKTFIERYDHFDHMGQGVVEAHNKYSSLKSKKVKGLLDDLGEAAQKSLNKLESDVLNHLSGLEKNYLKKVKDLAPGKFQDEFKGLSEFLDEKIDLLADLRLRAKADPLKNKLDELLTKLKDSMDVYDDLDPVRPPSP